MYVHRITFSVPDMKSMVTVNYKSEDEIISSEEYEKILSNLMGELKEMKEDDVHQPVLVGYMKTKE